MKRSQNSLSKADTSVRTLAESGILGLVQGAKPSKTQKSAPLVFCAGISKRVFEKPALPL